MTPRTGPPAGVVLWVTRAQGEWVALSQHKVHTQSSTNEKMPCKYEQQKARHQKLFGLLSKQNKFKEQLFELKSIFWLRQEP